MYYYGARYYDPRLNLWMSTDPLQEKYHNISSYCYTFNNTIREFGIRKGLKKLVISSKIRIFIGENQ